jgi:DNA-binding NtrC family response regulator
VITIWLPPLSQRTEDIPLLTEYFMSRFSQELGIDNPGPGQRALGALQQRNWPGNVRELANTCKKR